jgi:hypothetical protein
MRGFLLSDQRLDRAAPVQKRTIALSAAARKVRTPVGATITTHPGPTAPMATILPRKAGQALPIRRFRNPQRSPPPESLKGVGWRYPEWRVSARSSRSWPDRDSAGVAPKLPLAPPACRLVPPGNKSLSLGIDHLDSDGEQRLRRFTSTAECSGSDERSCRGRTLP